MTELFQIEPVLSPRLKWMREHGITSSDNGGGQPGPRFLVTHGWNMATGNTEDAALVELAKKLNLRLWNEV